MGEFWSRPVNNVMALSVILVFAVVAAVFIIFIGKLPELPYDGVGDIGLIEGKK